MRVKSKCGVVVRQPYKSRKPGRPYLDGVEYTIIPNRSTAVLAFITGMFDLTFSYEVTVPPLKGLKRQSPQAVCNLVSTNASTNLLVNREAPPFDNPDLRRALALALDRKSFIDILRRGSGRYRRGDAAASSHAWLRSRVQVSRSHWTKRSLTRCLVGLVGRAVWSEEALRQVIGASRRCGRFCWAI
jgi:ABC-type transport system substrate-binding protein